MSRNGLLHCSWRSIIYPCLAFLNNEIYFAYVIEAVVNGVVSASTGKMRKRYDSIYVDKYDNGTGDLSRSRKDFLF